MTAPTEPEFLHANVFDGMDEEGKPIVNRPPTRSMRVSAMLSYLQEAPLILSSRGFGPNAFTGEQNVPLGFHTDGKWIWPSAVAFYQKNHGVDPEPALYERIWENSYQLPEVPEDVQLRATDSVLQPPEPQVHLAKWERRFLRGLENLMRLAGVNRVDYQILEVAVEGHYLMLRPNRLWELSRIGDMSRGPRTIMKTSGDLREVGWAHLQAVLKPDEMPLTSLVFDHAWEWPYQPIADSPPLTVLSGKHFTSLPKGTLVDRYGSPAGNFAYTIGAPLVNRTMPPSQFNQDTEYHVYQVQRPVVALTGTAIPWYDLPGGAVGYIFGESMEAMIAAGVLAEVTPA